MSLSKAVSTRKTYEAPRWIFVIPLLLSIYFSFQILNNSQPKADAATRLAQRAAFASKATAGYSDLEETYAAVFDSRFMWMVWTLASIPFTVLCACCVLCREDLDEFILAPLYIGGLWIYCVNPIVSAQIGPFMAFGGELSNTTDAIGEVYPTVMVILVCLPALLLLVSFLPEKGIFGVINCLLVPLILMCVVKYFSLVPERLLHKMSEAQQLDPHLVETLSISNSFFSFLNSVFSVLDSIVWFPAGILYALCIGLFSPFERWLEKCGLGERVRGFVLISSALLALAFCVMLTNAAVYASLTEGYMTELNRKLRHPL